MTAEEQYAESSKEAVRLKLIREKKIFDPVGTDFEVKYLSEFTYFQGYLSNIYAKNGITNPYFLFRRDHHINASAYCDEKRNGNLITFTTGSVIFLKELFNNEIKVVKRHNGFHNAELLGDSISGFGEKITLRCLFYHECGHLIQFKNNSLRINELHEIVRSSEYFFEQHQMELDADTYAAVRVANHLFLFFDMLDVKHQNSRTLSDLICYVCGCISTYRVNYYNGLSFYLRSSSHPHLLVRMLNLITTLVEYSLQVIQAKYPSITLDIKDISDRSILFTNFMIREIHGVKKAQEIGSDIQMNIKKAADYAKELKEAAMKDKTSAISFLMEK